MTNEEKAKLLFQKYKDAKMLGEPLSRGSVAFQSSLEMAEWKDQQYAEEKKQWIEKACHVLAIILVSGVQLLGIQEFIENFKKAMEE